MGGAVSFANGEDVRFRPANTPTNLANTNETWKKMANAKNINAILPTPKAMATAQMCFCTAMDSTKKKTLHTAMSSNIRRVVI